MLISIKYRYADIKIILIEQLKYLTLLQLNMHKNQNLYNLLFNMTFFDGKYLLDIIKETRNKIRLEGINIDGDEISSIKEFIKFHSGGIIITKTYYDKFIHSATMDDLEAYITHTPVEFIDIELLSAIIHKLNSKDVLQKEKEKVDDIICNLLSLNNNFDPNILYQLMILSTNNDAFYEKVYIIVSESPTSLLFVQNHCFKLLAGLVVYEQFHSLGNTLIGFIKLLILSATIDEESLIYMFSNLEPFSCLELSMMHIITANDKFNYINPALIKSIPKEIFKMKYKTFGNTLAHNFFKSLIFQDDFNGWHSNEFNMNREQIGQLFLENSDKTILNDEGKSFIDIILEKDGFIDPNILLKIFKDLDIETIDKYAYNCVIKRCTNVRYTELIKYVLEKVEINKIVHEGEDYSELILNEITPYSYTASLNYMFLIIIDKSDINKIYPNGNTFGHLLIKTLPRNPEDTDSYLLVFDLLFNKADLSIKNLTNFSIGGSFINEIEMKTNYHPLIAIIKRRANLDQTEGSGALTLRDMIGAVEWKWVTTGGSRPSKHLKTYNKLLSKLNQF